MLGSFLCADVVCGAVFFFFCLFLLLLAPVIDWVFGAIVVIAVVGCYCTGCVRLN